MMYQRCLGVAALIAMTSILQAGDCLSSLRCPHCREVCHPKVSKEEVKKHCWDIDCKKVCVPRVTFPWQICKTQACCGCGDPKCKGGCPQPARCGRVRTIHVLKKIEYKCEHCKYTWEVDECKCQSGNCNSGACVQNEPVATPTEPEAARPEVAAAPVAQVRSASFVPVVVGALRQDEQPRQ
ncbi:MAG: hypothetical protein KDB14_04355 [Planctomycetales bacterium]|nr:hypothetical protein [Planctomycetales bacterium]